MDLISSIYIYIVNGAQVLSIQKKNAGDIYLLHPIPLRGCSNMISYIFKGFSDHPPPTP